MKKQFILPFFMFLFLLLPTVQAIADTTPPQITGISFLPQVYLHTQVNNVLVDVTDSESNVTNVTIEILNSNTTQTLALHYGTYVNGTWITTITEPNATLINFTIRATNYFNNSTYKYNNTFLVLNNSPVILMGSFWSTIFVKNGMLAFEYNLGATLRDYRILKNLTFAIENSSHKRALGSGKEFIGLGYYSGQPSTIGVAKYNLGNVDYNLVNFSYGLKYNITVFAEDVYGNNNSGYIGISFMKEPIAVNSVDILNVTSFSIKKGENFTNRNGGLSTVNNETFLDIDVNLMEMNPNLIFTMSISYYDEPINKITNFPFFGRYYSIDITNPTAYCFLKVCVSKGEIMKNISSAFLKFYYNDSEVASKGLNEGLLRLSRFNETSEKWEVCDEPKGGVNITGNYVYCNTTSFSEWGVIQIQEHIPTPVPTPAPSSSGSSSGGGGSSSSSNVSETISSPLVPSVILQPIKVIPLNENQFTITILSISANTSKEILINNTYVIQKISIKPTTTLNNVEVKIERVSLPADMPSPTTNVFEYLRVEETNITSDQTDTVNITFTVNKSWVSKNNINTSTIVLTRYTIQWDKLTTVKINETITDLIFTAISPGLSVFAITGETIKLEKNETIQSTELTKVPTGFVTFVRPELYPIIAVIIVIPLLILAYLFKKVTTQQKKQ